MLPSMGHTTIISGNSATAKLLNTTNYPKDGPEEKNISDGQRRISQIAEALHLKTADIIEPAKYYLKEIEVEKLLRGRSLEAKVAISLLFAGRRAGRSLKPEMLAKYARTRKEEINRCYKDLKRTPQFGDVQTRIMPVDKVKDACLKLNYHPEVKKAAIIVAENFIKMSICEGKKPATIAGAALFMVCLRLKTRPTESELLLAEISSAVEIGASTIRDCYQSAAD